MVINLQQGEIYENQLINLNEIVRQVVTAMKAQHVCGPTELRRTQKLSVRLIPLFQVPYTWKGKPFEFWVYGAGANKIHETKFPDKNCTIM